MNIGSIAKRIGTIAAGIAVAYGLSGAVNQTAYAQDTSASRPTSDYITKVNGNQVTWKPAPGMTISHLANAIQDNEGYLTQDLAEQRSGLAELDNTHFATMTKTRSRTLDCGSRVLIDALDTQIENPDSSYNGLRNKNPDGSPKSHNRVYRGHEYTLSLDEVTDGFAQCDADPNYDPTSETASTDSSGATVTIADHNPAQTTIISAGSISSTGADEPDIIEGSITDYVEGSSARTEVTTDLIAATADSDEERAAEPDPSADLEALAQQGADEQAGTEPAPVAQETTRPQELEQYWNDNKKCYTVPETDTANWVTYYRETSSEERCPVEVSSKMKDLQNTLQQSTDQVAGVEPTEVDERTSALQQARSSQDYGTKYWEGISFNNDECLIANPLLNREEKREVEGSLSGLVCRNYGTNYQSPNEGDECLTSPNIDLAIALHHITDRSLFCTDEPASQETTSARDSENYGLYFWNDGAQDCLVISPIVVPASRESLREGLKDELCQTPSEPKYYVKTANSGLCLVPKKGETEETVREYHNIKNIGGIFCTEEVTPEELPVADTRSESDFYKIRVLPSGQCIEPQEGITTEDIENSDFETSIPYCTETPTEDSTLRLEAAASGSTSVESVQSEPEKPPVISKPTDMEMFVREQFSDEGFDYLSATGAVPGEGILEYRPATGDKPECLVVFDKGWYTSMTNKYDYFYSTFGNGKWANSICQDSPVLVNTNVEQPPPEVPPETGDDSDKGEEIRVIADGIIEDLDEDKVDKFIKNVHGEPKGAVSQLGRLSPTLEDHFRDLNYGDNKELIKYVQDNQDTAERIIKAYKDLNAGNFIESDVRAEWRFYINAQTGANDLAYKRLSQQEKEAVAGYLYLLGELQEDLTREQLLDIMNLNNVDKEEGTDITNKDMKRIIKQLEELLDFDSEEFRKRKSADA